MAGLSRSASAAPARKHIMRPPTMTRPSSSARAHTSNSAYSRMHAGVASPAGSDSTMATAGSRSRSPASNLGGTKRKERDFEQEAAEETNINVVVRCRGRNDREVRENSGVVLSTDGVRGKAVDLSMGPSALSNKTYQFDKVFSPAADQAMIFDDVVAPILDEMLSGYNCTIFAYGQTGTGKTYTMSGDMSDTLGLVSDSAGIIPRVLHSLFTKLETAEAESSVKCSFIELYNEELRDLLSVEENAKLKIYEDNNRKGHTATMVQGMEESHIKDAMAGVKLLQDGSYKRQVAATKCNDLSSRSHTVFTITAYVKRTVDGGEDFVSAGKLNLVDLAGSENIQRSGAENKRAAEAGVINRSLLTLGRVINALVERGPHIPYRESKLTRLLQDSLGGRTKTCIIATVSPAKSNLEETISTLDYAFRAKNIRNKPQVNSMISKKTLLREFTAEIEKLKSELIATRQRNGVYLSNEAFEDMTGESESRRILSEEQGAKIETMEANLRNKIQELFSITTNFQVLKKSHDGTRAQLDETKNVLEQTDLILNATRQNLEEETILRKAHQQTEEELNSVGHDLLSTLGKTVTDVDGLHSKLRRRSALQTLNRSHWNSSRAQISDVTRLVEMRIGEFQEQQEHVVQTISQRMEGFVREELSKLDASRDLLKSNTEAFEVSKKMVSTQSEEAEEDMNQILEEIKVLRDSVKQHVGEGLKDISLAAERISGEIVTELGDFHTQLHESYSSLGRDFKNVFEDLVTHLNEQKSMAQDLREELWHAVSAAKEAEAAANLRLDVVLEEEKKQGISDRQQLLQQISGLLDTAGEQQDARLSSKIQAVRKDILSNRTTFDAAQRKYDDGMDSWNQKEVALVDGVLKSRETIKTKLKKDWLNANEHNTSIQKSTKSVHEQTVHTVDSQIKEFGTRMQALDDFVTRARFQNGNHHEKQSQSLNQLSSTVRESFNNIGNHFDENFARVNVLSTDMNASYATLRTMLGPLDANIKEPLAQLRSTVTTTSIREYEPTGETPQKIRYEYPTELPRTDAHENLLASLRNPASTSSPSIPLASPSKITNAVFTDSVSDEVAVVQPAVHNENDLPTIGGLREIDVNIPTNSIENGSISAAAATATTTESAPPLKRQNTSEVKVPLKASSKSSIVKLEGRENNTVPVFKRSASRRLRSSPLIQE